MATATIKLSTKQLAAIKAMRNDDKVSQFAIIGEAFIEDTENHKKGTATFRILNRKQYDLIAAAIVKARKFK